eukprot:623189-Pyramimonas_sp.AAC.2
MSHREPPSRPHGAHACGVSYTYVTVRAACLLDVLVLAVLVSEDVVHVVLLRPPVCAVPVEHTREPCVDTSTQHPHVADQSIATKHNQRTNQRVTSSRLVRDRVSHEGLSRRHSMGVEGGLRCDICVTGGGLAV